MLSPELLASIKDVFIQFMNPAYVAGVVHDKISYIKSGKADANSVVTSSYKVFDVQLCPGFWEVLPLIRDIATHTANVFLRTTMDHIRIEDGYDQARLHVKAEMDQLIQAATSIASMSLHIAYGRVAPDPARLERLVNLIQAKA
jgi:hypothetical protein